MDAAGSNRGGLRARSRVRECVRRSASRLHLNESGGLIVRRVNRSVTV